jgi:hypothetical protein
MNSTSEYAMALDEIFNKRDLALFEATAHLNFQLDNTPSIDVARNELLESRYRGVLPPDELRKRVIQMEQIPNDVVQTECINLTIGNGLQDYAKEVTPNISIEEQKDIIHQYLGNCYNVFASPYGVPVYVAAFTDDSGRERPLYIHKDYVADLSDYDHPHGYSFLVNYKADDGRVLATVHVSPYGTSFAGIQA